MRLFSCFFHRVLNDTHTQAMRNNNNTSTMPPQKRTQDIHTDSTQTTVVFAHTTGRGKIQETAAHGLCTPAHCRTAVVNPAFAPMWYYVTVHAHTETAAIDLQHRAAYDAYNVYGTQHTACNRRAEPYASSVQVSAQYERACISSHREHPYACM